MDKNSKEDFFIMLSFVVYISHSNLLGINIQNPRKLIVNSVQNLKVLLQDQTDYYW